MTSLLNEDKLDLAILLTEGMVASCVKGNKARIVKVFVNSSLEWGVHTLADRQIDFSGDDPITFAVSRLGSGSHLMALLYAKKKGISQERLQFKEVGSLDGAMKAFEEGTVQAFLWERFTTEPYCEIHGIQRTDSIYTPWPCFVAAVRPDFYEQHQQKLAAIFEGVFQQALQLKANPEAIAVIADRYDLSELSVREWYGKVEWGNGENLSIQEVEKVVQHLHEVGNIVSSEVLPREVLLEVPLSV